MTVTVQSMGWGAIAMLPLATAEWLAGARPTWLVGSVLGAWWLGEPVTGFTGARAVLIVTRPTLTVTQGGLRAGAGGSS